MLTLASASSPNIERAYKLAARKPHSPLSACVCVGVGACACVSSKEAALSTQCLCV